MSSVVKLSLVETALRFEVAALLKKKRAFESTYIITFAIHIKGHTFEREKNSKEGTYLTPNIDN